MKTIANNFRGELQVDYRIVFRNAKEDEDENLAEVQLRMKLPGSNEYTITDSVTRVSGESYKSNLKECFMVAEKKWGIDLLKAEMKTIKTA